MRLVEYLVLQLTIFSNKRVTREYDSTGAHASREVTSSLLCERHVKSRYLQFGAEIERFAAAETLVQGNGAARCSRWRHTRYAKMAVASGWRALLPSGF